MHFTLLLQTLPTTCATIDCYPNPETRHHQQRQVDCSPTDRARQLLSEVQLVLSGVSKTVAGKSKDAIKNNFNSLSNSVNSLIVANGTEARELTTKTEKDLIQAVTKTLNVLKALVENKVKSEYDKLETTTISAQTLANSRITTTVDYISKLTDVEAAVIVKDTQFGLQSKIFDELTKLFNTISDAASNAEVAIINKLNQEFVIEKNKLIEEIRRIFKDYSKGLIAVDSKYATTLRKDVDRVKEKLVAELTNIFNSSFTEGGLITVYFAKKLEDYLCLYVQFPIGGGFH
ncbi:hypothetical protein NUSPORA_02127 [Nucleospora cyclopteri]